MTKFENGSVDIILPTYNPTPAVLRAIESIVNQTYTEWRLYIVDDNSTHSLKSEIEKAIDSLGSERIKYIELTENHKAAYCRNYGLRQGTGEFVAFIDQDDEWLPNKLELSVQAISSRNEDCVHGDVEFIDLEGNEILREFAQIENNSRLAVNWQSRDLPRRLLVQPNIRLISSLVRRDVFESISGFRSELFGGEDEVFWFELSLQGSFYHIPKPLFRRREHAANTVKVHRLSRLKGYLKGLDYISKRYGNSYEEELAIKRKELRYLLLVQHLKKGKFYSFLFQLTLLVINHPVYIIKRLTSKVVQVVKLNE